MPMAWDCGMRSLSISLQDWDSFLLYWNCVVLSLAAVAYVLFVVLHVIVFSSNVHDSDFAYGPIVSFELVYGYLPWKLSLLASWILWILEL